MNGGDISQPGAAPSAPTNEQLKPTVPLAYMVVEHDADADDYSKTAAQFNFATGLGLFTTTKGGEVFAPIKVDGVTETLFIAAEKDISVETFTVQRDADPVANFGAKKVHIRYGEMPAEGFGSGKLAASLVANFDTPPTNGYKAMIFDDALLGERVMVYHDPSADEYPELEIFDGEFNVNNGVRSVAASGEGRAIPLGDEGMAGDGVYVNQTTGALYYEAGAGDEIVISTLDLFQGGGVYGGATFDYFLDEETGEIVHNTAFVSMLELRIVYNSHNVLLQVPYSADVTGMKSVYAKGESAMGQDDALVAIFTDEENHQLNFSQTLRPLQETQPETV